MSQPPTLVGTHGLITRCVQPEDEKLYHSRSRECMSSHQLRDFRRCPALFLRKRECLAAEPDRPAYLVGRALHCLVIEGRGEFDRRFAIGGPINEKTGRPYGVNTKAFADWARDKPFAVLAEDQAFAIERMAAAVAQHPLASRFFAGGVGEGVVRRDYESVPCQIRIDYLHAQHGLIDLKTTEDIDWFESDARKFGYLHQLAFYRAILAAAAGMSPDDIPCRLVAVEKVEPFRCGVWLVMAALLDDLALQNRLAIEEFKICETTGVWPTRYEEGRTFHA